MGLLAREILIIGNLIISYSEFLQQKWTKKNKQELAPNICYVIQRFNQVGKRIMTATTVLNNRKK